MRWYDIAGDSSCAVKPLCMYKASMIKGQAIDTGVSRAYRHGVIRGVSQGIMCVRGGVGRKGRSQTGDSTVSITAHDVQLWRRTAWRMACNVVGLAVRDNGRPALHNAM